MSVDLTKRGFLLFTLASLALAGQAGAQHNDSGGSDSGGHSGGQRGRPENPHDGDDDHSGDTGDDHEHEDDHGDDHGDDHASGGKGKGPKYRGGRDAVQAGFGRGHSLEDRILKEPHF